MNIIQNKQKSVIINNFIHRIISIILIIANILAITPIPTFGATTYTFSPQMQVFHKDGAPSGYLWCTDDGFVTSAGTIVISDFYLKDSLKPWSETNPINFTYKHTLPSGYQFDGTDNYRVLVGISSSNLSTITPDSSASNNNSYGYHSARYDGDSKRYYPTDGSNVFSTTISLVPTDFETVGTTWLSNGMFKYAEPGTPLYFYLGPGDFQIKSTNRTHSGSSSKPHTSVTNPVGFCKFNINYSSGVTTNTGLFSKYKRIGSNYFTSEVLLPYQELETSLSLSDGNSWLLSNSTNEITFKDTINDTVDTVYVSNFGGFTYKTSVKHITDYINLPEFSISTRGGFKLNTTGGYKESSSLSITHSSNKIVQTWSLGLSVNPYARRFFRFKSKSDVIALFYNNYGNNYVRSTKETNVKYITVNKIKAAHKTSNTTAIYQGKKSTITLKDLKLSNVDNPETTVINSVGLNVTLNHKNTGNSYFDVGTHNVNTDYTLSSYTTTGDLAYRYYMPEEEIAPTTITITQRPITPVVKAHSKVYDGTTDVDVDVTFNNLAEGDTLVEGIDYEVIANFRDAEADVNDSFQSMGTIVDYTITLKDTSLARNYSLTSNSGICYGAYIYGKNDTAIKDTKIYNGTELSNNFTFDDTINVETTLNLISAGHPVFDDIIEVEPVLPTDEEVDSYSIRNTDNTVDLYINGILVDSVSNAVKNPDVTMENHEYGTTISVPLKFSCNLSELTQLSVGTYPVTISYTGDVSNNSSQLGIGNITISAIDVKPKFTIEKDYDGSTLINGVEASGFVKTSDSTEIDTSKVSATFDVTTPSKDVGFYNLNDVEISNVKFTGVRANHYKCTTLDSVDSAISINQKALTPEISALDKNYDNTTYVNISNVEFNGLVPGEELNKDIDYTMTARFNNKNAGIDKDVTANFTLLSTETTKNYKLLNTTATTTATINKSDSDLTDYDIKNQDNVSTTDFDFNDTLKVEINPTHKDIETFDLDNVEPETLELYINHEKVDTIESTPHTTNTLQVDLSTLTDLREGLYPITVVYGGNDNLNKGQLNLGNINISAIPVKMEVNATKIYKGTTNKYVTNQKLYESETYIPVEDAQYNADIITSSKNVGTYNYTDLTATNNTIIGNRANHYKFDNNQFTDTSNVIINKKSITPTITASNKVYDKTTDATVEVNFNDIVQSESLSKDIDYNVTANFDNANVGSGKTVTATINLLDTTSANNYSITTDTAIDIADILKSDTTLVDAKIYNGNNLSTNFTFDDTINLTVTPKLSKLAKSSDYDTASLYINDILVDTQPATVDNQVKFNYDLSKLTSLVEGEYPVKVVYNGSDNTNSTSLNLSDINISAIDIIPSFNSIEKEYDGNTIITNVTDDGSFLKDNSKYPTNGKVSVTFDIITSKDVGIYNKENITISSIRFSGERANHYKITDMKANGTVTINQRPITPSITASDKVYDKNTNATLTDIKFSNLVSGEELTRNVDYNVSAKFDDLDVNIEKTVTATFSLIPTDITKNYKLTTNTATDKADITKANSDLSNYKIKNQNDVETTDFNFNDIIKVEITPTHQTLSLEDVASETVELYINNKKVATTNATPDTVNTLEFNLSNLTDIGEGSYPVKLVYGGDNNLNKSEISLSNIFISAIQVKMEAISSKVYDGTKEHQITSQKLYEVKTNNLVTDATYNATIISDSKNVGNYDYSSISTNKVTISGTREKHYKFEDYTFTNTSRLEIKQRPITATITANDKLYDSNKIATISNVNFDNLISNETLTVNQDYSVTAEFDNPNVGEGKLVTTDISLLSTEKANNYSLTTPNPTTTASITKNNSEITGTQILNGNNVSTTTFTFNDTLRLKGRPAIASLSSVEPNKVEVYIDDNKVTTVDCGMNATFTADIILNDLVTLNPGVHNVKVKWTGDNNLIASEVDLGNITINPIQVSSEISQSVEYNGTTSFSNIKYYSIKYKENNTTLPLTMTATIITESKDVGVRDIVSASDIKLYGDKSNHYSLISDDIIGTINIMKKSIKPISASVESKSYNDDNKVKVIDVQFEGLVLNEELTINTDYTAKGFLDTPDTGTDKEVTVTVTLSDTNVSNNYSLSTSTVNTSTTVDKSTPNLGIEISNPVVTYGEEYTIKVKPYVEKSFFSVGENSVIIENSKGDKLAESSDVQSDGSFVLTVPANNKLEIGQNTLNIRYGGSLNFFMKEQTTNVTMSRKETDVTITPINKSREYNGTPDFEISLYANDKFLSDDVTPVYNENNIVKVSSSNSSETPYSAIVSKVNITFTGNEGKYYKVKNIDTPIEVNGLTITPDIIDLGEFKDIIKVYDKNSTAFVNSEHYEVLNQNTDEKLNISIVANYDTPNVGKNKTVTITPTQNNPNYEFSQLFYTTDKGEITKSNSNINDTNVSKDVLTYGDTLTLKVEPNIERDLFSLSAPYDKVELFYNNVSLAQGDYNLFTGKYELEYDTTEKLLPVGTHNLKVSFGGSDNYAPSEKTVNVILKPKDISANYDLEYEYDNIATKQVTLNLEDIESEDRSNVNTITATLDLDEDYLNVGDTPEVNNITYNLDTPWYKLSQEDITGDIRIIKADLNNITSKTFYVKNKLEKEYTYDLSQFLPTLNNTTLGTVRFNDAELDETINDFIKDAYVDGDTLTILTNDYDSETEQEIAVVTVPVTTQNYNDFDLEFNINSTNKVKPVINVTPINKLTYGEELSYLEFNTKATYDDEEIEGELIINNPDDILDAGEHLIDLTFIPDDNNIYDEVEISTTINIDKAVADKVRTPEYEKPSTEETMSEVEFIDKGEFIGYDGNTIDDYEVEWVECSSKPVYLNNYTYRIDHKNYTYSESIPLIFDLSVNTPTDDNKVMLPDGTIVPDNITENGVTILPNETIEKPNGDIIIFPNGGYIDNEGNIEGDYITQKPDSSIVIPNGTVITPNNGQDLVFGKDEDGNVVIIIPEGTIIDGEIVDAGIYYPDSDDFEPDEVIVIETPDNNLFIPPNSVLVPNKDTVVNNGTIIVEEDTIIKLPNGTVITYPESNNSVTVPPNSIIKYPYEDNITLNPDKTISTNTGIVIFPDDTIILPNGTIIPPTDHVIIDGNNIKIPEDAVITKPNGNKIEFPIGGSIEIKPDGSISITGGIEKLPSGNIVLPDGSVIPNKDVNISTDGNIKFEIPKDTIIESPNGDKDFTYGGTIIITPDGIVVYNPNNKPSSNNSNRPSGGGSVTKPTEPEKPVEKPQEPVQEPIVETPNNNNTNNETSYTDINDSHWASNAVEYLSNIEVLTGYPDGTFKPNDNIKRGDIAIISDKIISHLKHDLNIDKSIIFKDVYDSQYYYRSIQKLYSYGLLSGYSDGSFKPNNEITREESFVVISKFIDKYCEGLKLTDTPMVYKDYDDVAEWAKPYLDNLNRYGIVKGDTNKNVNPKDKVTRAEICQMLYSILYQLESNK